MKSLAHFNPAGRARMVDVTEKPETQREAAATGAVFMRPETLDRIRKGRIGKGDVLAVAQVAGVMAAKKAPDLIPMCHSLLITSVEIGYQLLPGSIRSGPGARIVITATVKTRGSTGVEMEALTAVCATALTIYDMCKSADREMRFGEIMLVSKTGGKSGTYRRPVRRVK